ncbi:hypothetical protein AGMMS50229_19180 [Campylobacterota bacterium]|nr:hypothetical protein AGMMS50229_19180 [Campylobacterota bacterium]
MMGAMVGSIIPGIGTGIGAAVSGVMGAINVIVSNQAQQGVNAVDDDRDFEVVFDRFKIG